MVRTKRKTTLWALMGSMSLLRLADRARERGDDLEHVADYTVVGDLEDRRLLVLVDGDDGLRGAHPREMLDRAGDADSDVELRAHLASGLADLIGMWTPPFVGDSARRADGGVAEGVGQ